MPTNFTCARTCKVSELCQFWPLLRELGSKFHVHSHTVTVSVEYRDPDRFARAAVSIGGTDLGNGVHQLFDGQSSTGRGIQLPGWSFPIVLTNSRKLEFDDYGGHWGNRADLKRIESAYVSDSATFACEQLGWTYEQQPNGSLLVYHPSGGTLTVSSSGEIDANGFHGQGCGEATAQLAGALGTIATTVTKPEFNETQQAIAQS